VHGKLSALLAADVLKKDSASIPSFGVPAERCLNSVTERPMIQFIYVSSEAKPFTNEELLELLDKSRKNNEQLGITGMLLYKNGDFMQALEGEEIKVRWLSAQIAKDPRHKNFVSLMDGPITEREFPDWSMGFRNLNELDSREVPGYSTFLDSPLRAENFAEAPSLARTFLLLFKDGAKAG
jgi:hypothetical protein